jgi:hypothetical protein
MRKPLVAILLVACATLTGCGQNTTADPNINASPGAAATSTAKAKKSSKYYSIKYEIAGSSESGDITYTTPSGMSQNGHVRLPWHATFKVRKTDFQMLDVSAMNNASGSITCAIYVDGKKVKAGKSTGQYSNVDCTHTIGGM